MAQKLLSIGTATVSSAGTAVQASAIARAYPTILDTSVQNHLTLEDPIGFILNSSDVVYFIADTDTNASAVRLRFSLRRHTVT